MNNNSLLRFILKLWGNRIVLFLFLLNLLTNSVLLYYPVYSSFHFISEAITVSALFALVEGLLYRLLSKFHLHSVFLVFIVFLHILIFLTDIFLFRNFNYLLGQETIEILAQTTISEAKAFLSTYVSIPSVLCLALSLFFIIWFLKKVALKLSNNITVSVVFMVLSIIGVCFYLISIANYVLYQKGQFIPQMHSFTRAAYSSTVLFDRHEQIIKLREINAQVKASKPSNNVNTIILIIGESFSTYHSSLYGYSKETNPLLMNRFRNGSMTVFSDVVSYSDHTETVMNSVFPVNERPETFFTDPLFPCCFKAAGYHTTMLDNQYFVDTRISFLTDSKLSELMFDYRNTKEYNYDGEMLHELHFIDSPQLIVVHLKGQHFTYSDRYPKQFTHFTSKDYSNLSEEQKKTVAHYDNATLYNDFVIDQIIKSAEDRDCLIIYFSDHGQDVFEIDGFMGHGCAVSRPDPIYQIKVPLIIWTSDIFCMKHADKAKRIKESGNKPIITSDLPHFLLDVADIDTDCFNPDQSFINDTYRIRKRIILNDIDYEMIKKKPRIKTRYN